ncbi:MAG: HAD family phosphatase [Lachnospiraceae bacterium]|nr:HAD family phosphatase [Lachnospiraceae bacterium]
MKILFTDLDGTLLNKESKVSVRTKKFLDEFTAAGNKLVLSSGRPLDSIIEVKEKSGLDYDGVIIIASNGTQIYDCDSKTAILEKRMPLSYVSYLQARARECGLHIHTYTDDAIVCDSEDAEIIYYRRRIHLPLVIADDYASALPKEPFKMLAIDLKDHDKLTNFRTSISDWASDKISSIFSNDYYLELFVHDAGKGNAVRYIYEHFGVSREDTYAAGDAQNDISMIEAAGCGIAMLNSPDIVKKAADVITQKDNDNDGLAEYMWSVLE